MTAAMSGHQHRITTATLQVHETPTRVVDFWSVAYQWKPEPVVGFSPDLEVSPGADNTTRPHTRGAIGPGNRNGNCCLVAAIALPTLHQIWNQQNACEDNIISGTKRGSGLTPGGGGVPAVGG